MPPTHPQNPLIHTPSTSLQSSPSASGGQTEGMLRQNALTNVSDSLCALRMTAQPHTSSAIHHHGDQDTIVFAFSGKGGAVVSEGGKKRQEVNPGDFVLIPAYAEHQEVNDGEEEIVWCIVRSGREPKVVNLEEWGGVGSS